MSQVSKRKLKPKAEVNIQKTFIKILSSFKTEQELGIFLESFLSKTERIMLAKRFLVLYLLEKENKIQEIADTLNITPATIVKLNFKRKLDHENLSLAFKKMDKEVLKESVKDLAKTVGLEIAKHIAKHAKI